MSRQGNIVLVGFMGTGKTTVGTALVRKLGLAFVDMDHLIEQRQGKPISRIFAEQGEPFFRALERQLVAELAGRTGLVIGTGGGIVLNAENVSYFSRTGLVVCLMATPEAILKRLENDTQRPLLAGGDKMQKITGLLDKRRPLYEAIPHRIDTSELTVEQVADRIITLYRAWTEGKPGMPAGRR